jgi:hypothetical protein
MCCVPDSPRVAAGVNELLAALAALQPAERAALDDERSHAVLADRPRVRRVQVAVGRLASAVYFARLRTRGED